MIILYTLLALAAAGAVALLAGYLHNRQAARQGIDPAAEKPVIPDSECCGQHEVCEKESLLAAVSKGQIEYYEDEELDAFRGRPADQYSEAETESFRDVLYTMRSEEVAGWVRSLALRGVELPDGLKDEVVMIVSERRTATL